LKRFGVIAIIDLFFHRSCFGLVLSVFFLHALTILTKIGRESCKRLELIGNFSLNTRHANIRMNFLKIQALVFYCRTCKKLKILMNC